MDKLQTNIDQENIDVIETKLPNRLKGLCLNGDIYIDTSVRTHSEYRCVMAEELGHYFTSDGNSLNYRTIRSQREEDRAHRWAFEEILPVENFINAYKHGCRNRYETAEFLNVTEEFLEKAVEHYKSKHGTYVSYCDYVIYFDPLGVMKKY